LAGRAPWRRTTRPADSTRTIEAIGKLPLGDPRGDPLD
jgi:hypothetical protein